MKRNAWFLIVLALLTGTGLLVAATGGQAPAPGDFAMYQRLMQEGNFQEAYVGLRALCLNPATKATESTNSLRLAVNCLQRLGRLKEVDELLEQAVAAHDRDWRLLRAAAQQYESLPHQGFLIAGAFERGPHRGGGSVVNSYQRDRVRALQLMTMALTLANADDRKDEVAQFYLHLADVLL